MSKKIHASLSYHEEPFTDVKTFCQGIINGYYGNNPPFTVLTISQVDYQALIDTYELARIAYENGGTDQRGDFLIAYTNLMDATDEIAHQTDLIAKGNTDIIELAEFVPTKPNSTSVKPAQCIAEVERGIGGELIASCLKIYNAKHYICFMTEGAPLPAGYTLDADGRLVWIINPPVNPPFASLQIDFTDQRIKHFKNLKHDVTYYFYFFAVNAKGVGPVSEVVSMECW